MYQQMLKTQRVTFVSDVEQAKKFSPFYEWFNPYSERWVVSDNTDPSAHRTVAAGLSKEEAEAAVMFYANQYIYRNVQK